MNKKFENINSKIELGNNGKNKTRGEFYRIDDFTSWELKK